MGEETIKVIYLLGGAHSGSTLLSLLLGTSDQIFNAGELKFYSLHRQADFPRWQEIKNVCMCGAPAGDCPFWAEVEALAPNLNAFYAPGVKGYLNLFLYNLGLLPRQETDDAQILHNILVCARQTNPEVNSIFDMSKSLPRLDHLLQEDSLEISALFLIRDPRGYVNSFRKRHRKGFFRWIAQWALLNTTIKAYLVLKGIKHLIIPYEKLTSSSKQELARIKEFLTITLPEDYLAAINRKEFHVRAGNPAMIEKKIVENLTPDHSWEIELSGFQASLIKIISFPFELFLYS